MEYPAMCQAAHQAAAELMSTLTQMEAVAVEVLDTIALERAALKAYFPDVIEDYPTAVPPCGGGGNSGLTPP